jgi:3-hydroxy-3-methylglutaryl CoA synthase
MYALESAVCPYSRPRKHETYAIVIATDIAKYPLGSAGEYTLADDAALRERDALEEPRAGGSR